MRLIQKKNYQKYWIQLYSRKLRFAKFIARICPRTPRYLENFFVRGYKCNIIVMYKFGMIIPDKYTKKWPFFNIHLGDIRLNRGGHSLRWSILEGNQSTKITIYQIDGLDEGKIVDEIKADITKDDDVEDNYHSHLYQTQTTCVR